MGTGMWAKGVWKDESNDCYVHAPGQYEDQGCSQLGPTASTGQRFNREGGGTFAAEWSPRHGHIRTWFWPAGSEPLNLKEQQLDPAVWGKPYSHFLLDIHACPQRHFESMRLHFDLTFCSDRAKSAYSYQC